MGRKQVMVRIALAVVTSTVLVAGCKKKEVIETSVSTEIIETTVAETTAPEFDWTDMNVPEVFDVEMIKDSFLLAEPRASADRLQSVSAGDIFSIHVDCRVLVGEIDSDYYGTELVDGTIGYLDAKYFEWVIADEADMEDEVLVEAEATKETAIASIQAENFNVVEETSSSNVESQVTAETAIAVSETKVGVSDDAAVQVTETQAVVQAKSIQSSGTPDASQMTTEELVSWLNSQGVDAQIGIGQAEDCRDSSDYATYDFQAEINPNMSLE